MQDLLRRRLDYLTFEALLCSALMGLLRPTLLLRGGAIGALEHLTSLILAVRGQLRVAYFGARVHCFFGFVGSSAQGSAYCSEVLHLIGIRRSRLLIRVFAWHDRIHIVDLPPCLHQVMAPKGGKIWIRFKLLRRIDTLRQFEKDDTLVGTNCVSQEGQLFGNSLVLKIYVIVQLDRSLYFWLAQRPRRYPRE